MALKRSCSKNSRRRSDSEAIGRIVHVYSILHAVLHVSCGVYQKHPKTLLFVERWLPGVLVVKSFHVETRGEEGTVWWGQPLVPVKLGDVFNARRSMVAKIGSIQKKRKNIQQSTKWRFFAYTESSWDCKAGFCAHRFACFDFHRRWKLFDRRIVKGTLQLNVLVWNINAYKGSLLQLHCTKTVIPEDVHHEG